MTDFKNIKAMVFDIDGIFTDGGIYAVDGDLLRRFEAKDCMSTRIAYMNGMITGIITGGISKTIVQRMERCGFNTEDIFLGCRRKIEEFEIFCKNHDLRYDEVLYCGDDLPDIPVLKVSGVSACPSDAVDEVKAVCNYVSEYAGGHQFVRKLVEEVLKAQNKWYLDDVEYKKAF